MRRARAVEVIHARLLARGRRAQLPRSSSLDRSGLEMWSPARVRLAHAANVFRSGRDGIIGMHASTRAYRLYAILHARAVLARSTVYLT